MPRETLIDFFDDLYNKHGEFIIYDNGYRTQKYTYRDVALSAKAFSLKLLKANFKKGDKVIFFSENRPEWVIAFWGCILAGVVVVPIDYQASSDFLKSVQQIVKSRLILIGEEVSPPSLEYGILSWRLSDIERSLDSVPYDNNKTLDHADKSDAGEIETPELINTITRDDVAEIIFTSGATAEPKGVLITHRNLLANIVPIEREALKFHKYLRPFSPIRSLNLPPLSHLFGQAVAIFVTPMISGTVVFMRGYNPYEIVRQVRRRRITVLVCVPKMLDVLRFYILRTHPEAASLPHRKRHIALRWIKYLGIHRLFGLKFWCFVAGAAPLDPELEEFWSSLGFIVIQGYGLTETAPVVSFNNPLDTHKGSVGKPMPGVEVKLAEDGEILVRGEAVTPGYYQTTYETSEAFHDGWLHTGDIGSLDEEGRLYILGRKKEMIVTPEGLNVFPEDVERVLNSIPGVRESAVVGTRIGGEERIHAVIVLESFKSGNYMTEPNELLRLANSKLTSHQKIRSVTIWHGDRLPRTVGTQKLKRLEIKEWIEKESLPSGAVTYDDTIESFISKISGYGPLKPGMTIEELGLSSLERVELLMELEERFQTRIDELAFARARDAMDIRSLVERSSREPILEPIEFPSWNRHPIISMIRRLSLATWILPLCRLFARARVEGGNEIKSLEEPVIFASNHKSHIDTLVIFSALPKHLRYNLAPAMSKDFFEAHFFPEKHSEWQRFSKSIEYYLVTLFFNAFPLPQREAGARQALQYIGEMVDDGFSILIFPEGGRSEGDEIKPLQPGVALMASRLKLPIVPVLLEGTDRVLPRDWKMARPGRVRVVFGKPLCLEGDDYQSLTKRVEEAIKKLT
jgi:long-chain acyl-CoA synthetase